uniref:Agenet domain containing protein n=1 Tax=Zea mays TaxID=4577 RepID=B6U1B3_MAIZE|nr:agenet domain containing protein [Zea mays]
MDLILPYKVGDLAESKSLVSGYRGAWFRCKIHNMRVRLGYLECYLEYIDYPGEKKEWVRLFRKNSARSNQNSSDSIHTMIRPSFPKWYFVHEVPEQFPNSDVTAIVDETWQIGDRVDWLKEGCYWSGTITKIINEDLVEIELPAPPIGEGKCYKAKCSDLRPTLEWSLARGWMVPLSQANGKGWHAARLLQHYKSESDDDNDDNDSCDARQTVCRASNTHEEAPGPMVPAPPSATNNAPSHMYQKDAAVASTEDLLKPSSTSKSPDPRHDAQASTQPAGTGVSMKPEPVIGVSTIKKEDSSLAEGEVDGGTEECLEKLGAIKARLKYLMQGTRLEHERSATFRG